MKYLIYTIAILALVLTGYNLTYIDFNEPLEGDSGTAVLLSVAGLCVIVLMGILLISRKINAKHK